MTYRHLQRALLPRGGVVALAAACTALVLGGSAFAASSTVTTTSTGVVTHGSIKTTPYTVGWLLRCGYSHTLRDDPIVLPNQVAASHAHDFFGNISTNARSTFAAMQAGGTTCGTQADTAGYWQPTVVDNGVTVRPDTTGQQIYYRHRYARGIVAEPIPPDLRITAGNSHATSIAANPALMDGHIYWECAGNTQKHYQTPPSCGSAQTVVENVEFASCWDGTLTHINDTAHMAYAPDAGSCPGGFPHALPRISLKVKYPVGYRATNITLSSGPAYTAHSDFWNTWQPNGLIYLVTRCINAHISCGTNPTVPPGG
jgi:hypothetical protein